MDVTLSRETFDRIMAQKQMLDALMIAGVEQWPGYAVARRLFVERNNPGPVDYSGCAMAPVTSAALAASRVRVLR